MTDVMVHPSGASHPDEFFARVNCSACRPELARLVHRLANDAAEEDARRRLETAIGAEGRLVHNLGDVRPDDIRWQLNETLAALWEVHVYHHSTDEGEPPGRGECEICDIWRDGVELLKASGRPSIAEKPLDDVAAAEVGPLASDREVLMLIRGMAADLMKLPLDLQTPEQVKSTLGWILLAANEQLSPNVPAKAAARRRLREAAANEEPTA